MQQQQNVRAKVPSDMRLIMVMASRLANGQSSCCNNVLGQELSQSKRSFAMQCVAFALSLSHAYNSPVPYFTIVRDSGKVCGQLEQV